MDIPKWSLQILFAAGAVCLGWIAKDALGGIASGPAESTPQAASQDSTDELVEALSALAPRQHEPAPAPVERTIVVGDGGAPVVATPQSLAPRGGAVAVRGASGAPDHRGPGTGTLSPTSSGVLNGHGTAPHTADNAFAGSDRGAVTGPDAVGSIGTDASGGPSPWRALLHEFPVAVPTPLRESTSATVRAAEDGAMTSWSPPASSTPAMSASNGVPTSDALSLSLSPERATAAIGEHIVIAYDGSMVLVGDNGRLTGNTGDAGHGGVVALDAQSSAFSTESAPRAGSATVAARGAMTALGTGTSAGSTGGSGPSVSVTPGFVPNAPPGVVSPLTSPIVSLGHGRAVDIAGYEDHSLAVRGQRNILTYDDSNVFIDREGRINANTGDLDSGGLNAVNTVRSNVSAGPHCDDGCDDESIIQAEAGVFDEGDVAIDGNGDPVWAPGTDAGVQDDATDGDDEGDDSLPTDTGDDGDADSELLDESDDGDVPDPVEPAETREEADTTREAADTGVDPAQRPVGDSVTIGGDGWDDLGVRVDGADNTLTYDDSNVVLGGTGDVNAQIGDADTGGVAVMNTEDSEAHGGNSR